MIKKSVAILGSTGSIGTQALNIIKEFSDDFEVKLISANSSHKLLLDQSRVFKPKHVVINTNSGYNYSKKNLTQFETQTHLGNDALCELIESEKIDIVLVAIVGFAALMPTISAIKSGKKIALANKETLVVGGQIISSLLNRSMFLINLKVSFISKIVPFLYA